MTDAIEDTLVRSPRGSTGAAGEEALRLIQAERKRQIEVEGWSPEHDDEHDNGEMLRAAVVYMHYGDHIAFPSAAAVPDGWPWNVRWWKPKNRRSNLIRAGALCLAEKDRLARMQAPSGHVDQKLNLVLDKLGAELASAPAGQPATGDGWVEQVRSALIEARVALNGGPNTVGLHSQLDAAIRICASRPEGEPGLRTTKGEERGNGMEAAVEAGANAYVQAVLGISLAGLVEDGQERVRIGMLAALTAALPHLALASQRDLAGREWRTTPEKRALWRSWHRDGEPNGYVCQLFDDLDTALAKLSEAEAERDGARALVTEANNSLFGSQGYFYSLNGGPFDKYHLSSAIEDLKRRTREDDVALQAALAERDEARKMLAAYRKLLDEWKADCRTAEARTEVLEGALRQIRSAALASQKTGDTISADWLEAVTWLALSAPAEDRS